MGLEWDDETLPLHTEPQQSSAGPSMGKKARASSFQTEQQQVVSEIRSQWRRAAATTANNRGSYCNTDHTKLWNQKVRVTLLVRVGVFVLCLTPTPLSSISVQYPDLATCVLLEW